MDCEDDDHAVAQARMLVRDHPLEVWLGDRRVRRIEPGEGV
ncbi:MAG: hypothetical protein WDM92_09350 [Caulobacteraceae bacterium]